MKRWAGVLLLAAVCLAASAAQAHDRTALVIANYDYGEHQLTKVKAEAVSVGDALRREGFRVTVAENVPVKELKVSIEQFARGTATRGVAVLYFAGLGGQYQSQDGWSTSIQGAGKPSDPRSPERESMSLADIAKLFADHSSALVNCIVLDAARANPYLADRPQHRAGLASVNAAELADDTLVFLAASPDQWAGSLDTPSHLAAAWATQLPLGRKSFGHMFEAIVADVEKRSGSKQQPWYAAGLSGNAPSRRAASGAYARTGRPALDASWPPEDEKLRLNSAEPRAGERAGQEWVNASGMVFCWCPPGTFMMGAAAGDRPGFDDAASVEVTLTKGFWIGKYEACQIEGRRVGWEPMPSLTKQKLSPMHNLTHDNPKKFVDLLAKAEQHAGRLSGNWEYALPSEAQWEYACRAGTATRFSFGDDESQLCRRANYADMRLLADEGAMQFADARFDDGVGRALAIIGSYQPNAWGLHDMHGNVAEWCADRYLASLPGGVDPLVDQSNKQASGNGVIRGGAWCSTATYCESAFRNAEFAGKQRDFIGFRVVLRQK